MRSWMRPTTIALAVFAIIFANCYAPRLAHARPQAAHAAAVQVQDQDAMPCHERSTPHSTAGDTSPYCCAAACGTAAFIFGSAALDGLPWAEPAFAPPGSFLRPISPTAIDPPPRLA